MKKLAILTSLLALAACGGGSGGGNGGLAPIAPVTDAARESNKSVTQMASEILVANGASAPIITRGASGRVNMDGKEYTSYRLNDVEFTQADLDDNNEDINFKFHVNPDGQIDKIVYNDGWTLTRQGNTNKFEIQGNPHTTGTAELKTYGALKYADFGIMHIEQVEDGESLAEDMAFAGGYDVMEIDEDKIQKDIEFTGRAVGGVVTEYNGNGSNGEAALVLDTNDAKLAFATNGTETLTMNFDNWYDVKITKRGDITDVQFTNGDTKNIANQHQFTKGEYKNFTQNSTPYWQDGVRGTYESDMYGENGTPSEATAVTFISETSRTEGGYRETNLNVAFGGTAK